MFDLGEKELATLERCELFSDIAVEQLPALLDDLRASKRSYLKDEIIFLAGGTPKNIGVVLSGEVQLVRETSQGERILHDDLGPGATFGLARALAETRVSPVSVVAAANCEVLTFSAETLQSPSFGQTETQLRLLKNTLREVARKNVRANRRLSYLHSQDLRSKICRYLHFYQKYSGADTFTIPFDRNELASFLAVNRSALSRELSRMQDEGLIEFSRSTFTVLTDLEFD